MNVSIMSIPQLENVIRTTRLPELRRRAEKELRARMEDGGSRMDKETLPLFPSRRDSQSSILDPRPAAEITTT